MKYFKYINSEGVICYTFGEIENSEYEEITEEVFNSAMAEMQANQIDDNSEPTYEELQEQIEALEEENAALLFENLTGEAFV